MNEICGKAAAVFYVNLVAFIIEISRNNGWNNFNRLLSYGFLLNGFFSYRLLSYRLFSYRLFSYRLLSYRLLSYRFLNYRFLGHFLFNDFLRLLGSSLILGNLLDYRSNVWLVNENSLWLTVNGEELNCEYSIVITALDNRLAVWLNSPTDEG